MGASLSRREMLRLALMSSENRAASSLARYFPGGASAAVTAMNRKAMALGMTRTHYADPTGLSPRNVSTANDLARLVHAAAEYPTIRDYSTTPAHFVEVQPTGHWLGFNNSNALVKNQPWDIQLQKTGYIREAGRCLVMLANIASRPLVIVLLDSNGKYTRLGDAQRVKQWIETGVALATADLRRRSPHGPFAPAARPRPRRRRRSQCARRRPHPRAAPDRALRPGFANAGADGTSTDSPPLLRRHAARRWRSDSSFACARVLAVISLPPSIRASSSTRSPAASGASVVTTPLPRPP